MSESYCLLQEFKRLIDNYFNNEKTNPFRYFLFQYEKNYNTQQDKDIHIQRYFILHNQIRIGSYLNIGDKKNEKVLKKTEHSGIKKLLKIQKIHFDELNSNDPENKIMRYRCDFQELNDFSKYNWYDIDCCSKRTLARYDNKSGFLEYGTYKTSSKNSERKNQHRSLKNKRYLMIDEEISAIGIMNDLINRKISAVKSLERKKMKRCWKPCNMFLYSDNSRVRKGYLLSVLFPNAYERRNNGQEKYLETLNLLDCKEYSVQIKGSDINFCPFVIAYTANTSIRFIYNFCEDKHLKSKSEQNYNNTKLFSTFGDIEDFFKFKFEIEFNYDVTLEKAKEIIKGRNRTIEELDNILYYRDEYLVDKSKYILGPIELYYPDLYISDSR
ncbi:7755_t:CDS:2, partial [Scutellospora calospora]